MRKESKGRECLSIPKTGKGEFSPGILCCPGRPVGRTPTSGLFEIDRTRASNLLGQRPLQLVAERR